MSYQLFQKAAAINSDFEVIPSKISILAKGITINKDGYIEYQQKTYMPNIVKLVELPRELQVLFLENKMQVEKSTHAITKAKEDRYSKLDNLNKILFEQLQNIVDPEEGVDANMELKKANTVCNIADKLIDIADLSLKAEIFYDKKNTVRSIYE